MFTEHHPATIQVEETPRGVRYTFPPAPGGGCVRAIFSLPLVLFGASFLAMSVLALGAVVFVGINAGPGAIVIALIFAAMTIVSGLVGLVAFGIGMHILKGNIELELADGALISRVGWWRLKRSSRRELASISRLVMDNPLSVTRRNRTYLRAPDGRLQNLSEEEAQRQIAQKVAHFSQALTHLLAKHNESAVLEVHCRNKAPLLAAWGQLPKLLGPVVQDLARRSGVPIEDRTETAVPAGYDEERPQREPRAMGIDAEHYAAQPAAPAIDLDTLPIATGSASFRDKKLVQVGPHECRLQLSWFYHLLWSSFGLIGSVVLLVLVVGTDGFNLHEPEQLALLGCGSLFLLISAVGIFLPAPMHFDRAQRTMTHGHRLGRDTLDLRELQAVQVIPGRYRRSTSSGSRGYQPFELNLAFASGFRFNLSNNLDLQWTRETARLLADFLQVPLVDQT